MFVRLHIYIIYAFCNTTALKLQRIHTCVSDALELDIEVYVSVTLICCYVLLF